MFYFIFLFFAAFFLLRVSRGKRISRVATSIISVNLALLSLYFFVDALSGNGFDESVIYHLVYGLEGAGILAFAPYIAATLGVIGFSVFLSVFLSRPSLNASRERDSRFFTFAIIFGFLVCILVNPLVTDFRDHFPMLKAALSQGKRFEEQVSQFKQSKVGRLIADEASGDPAFYADSGSAFVQKNIIWIYAESIERTYFNKEVFGDLLVNLSSHREGARRYTAVTQPWGTGWTIGGIVGSQCGLPLVTLGASNGNSLANLRDFMPGAHCVGDILKKNGYKLEFVGGASAEFAGKGNFLRSHGFTKVWDRESLSEMYDNGSKERNQWGYYDDFIFSVLKSRAIELHNQASPFFLNGLTLDTHSPHGFVSPSCNSIEEVKESSDIGAALRCSDYLLADFIDWFKSSDLYEDTLLVLSSDHLSMPNSLYKSLKNVSNREILFWVIGKDVAIDAIEEPVSTFDIGATVLGHVLYSSDISIGLGRNIEHQQSLYNRQFSDADLKQTVSGLQAFAWRKANGAQSMVIDVRGGAFSLGGQSYPIPALVEVSDGQFSGISWVERERKERFVDLMRPDAAYVWLDVCGWSLESRFAGSIEPCVHFVDAGVIVGSKGLSGSRIVNVNVDDVLTVIGEFEGPGATIAETIYAVATSGSGGAGGLMGESVSPAGRGVNIFEKKGSSTEWDLVANFDFCSESREFTPTTYKVSPSSPYTAIVVNDSAHCGSADELKELSSMLGVRQLGSLNFRQPYIALLKLGESPIEFLGAVGSNMIVALPES